MTLVTDCHTARVVDPETGVVSFVTETRQIDVPDVLTLEEGVAATAAQAQVDANASTLQTQATQALANLRAFRDLASPTNAQTLAAVKLLCAVAIGLIRLQLADFDGTD